MIIKIIDNVINNIINQFNKLRMLWITSNTKNRYNKNVSSRGMRSEYTKLVPRYYVNANRQCAIGIRMKHPEFYELSDDDVQELNSSTPGGINTILKLPYRGLPLLFWENIQAFHDDSDNWDENGITQDGIKNFIQIIEDIKNDKYTAS